MNKGSGCNSNHTAITAIQTITITTKPKTTVQTAMDGLIMVTTTTGETATDGATTGETATATTGVIQNRITLCLKSN